MPTPSHSSGSRTTFVSVVLAAALAAAAPLSGCGDDDPGDGGDCASTEVDEFPDGPYARPDDLEPDDSDCDSGSLADVDLNGRWSLTGERQFTFEMPYVRESCEAGVEIDFNGYPDRLIHRDDTSLFWRTWSEGDDFRSIIAKRACAIPGSDELAVAIGRCFRQGGDESCAVEQGRMKRFGRPPGEGEAEGLELVSEWEGGEEPWLDSLSLNVKVAGGVAFLSRFGELRLIDVSDPAHPSDLGAVPSEDDPDYDFNDVKLFQAGAGTHAILAGALTPIVDATDPTAPAIVARLGEYSHSVFVGADAEGRPLAYLAGGSDVPIYDLSDPASPVLVERVPLPEGVATHDLYAEPDRLYVNATTSGFLILDRDETGWTVNGTLPSPYSHASWVGEAGGRRIAITGDEGRNAYLHVVDVDPGSATFMDEIGSYQTRPEVSIHNMMLLGDRVYLTYYHDGARILDLSDPTEPTLAAYFHTWDVETGAPGGFEGAIGLDVDLEAGLLYVADIDRGLLILRETE